MDKKTVLFVDDEHDLLHTLEMGLVGEPYERLFADSGAKALEIMESEPVHVIVCDLRMPEMNGLELLQQVKEKWPSTVRMILSGYAHVSTLINAINKGNVYKFIMKPWKLEDDFKPSILEALSFYDAQLQTETCGVQGATDTESEESKNA